MNLKDLNYFRFIIQKKRDELILNISKQKNIDIRRFKQYGIHMADIASDTMEIELKDYFTHRQLTYLQNLDKALARLENGNYGECIVCGNIIPKNRLKAVPHTNYCVPCKS
ncbi:TraR/DksA family transcriptional regulator [Calditrichota bacterium]